MAFDLLNIDGIRPLRVDTEFSHITPGRTYTIRQFGSYWACNCGEFLACAAPKDICRTCPHLREALGAEYEDIRVRKAYQSILPATLKRRVEVYEPAASTSTIPSPSDTTVQPRSKKPRISKRLPNGVMLGMSWIIETDVSRPTRSRPAESFDPNEDPSGWILSEKLDGIRAYWNGEDSLISRKGARIPAPQTFTDKLPKNVMLDGELFLDRQSFKLTCDTTMFADQDWRNISFVVYDIPDKPRLTVEDRLEQLKILFADAQVFKTGKKHVPAGEKAILLLDQKVCRNRDHLQTILERVEAVGGEGLMLRKPGSLYVYKRSRNLCKVKTYHDAEAVVVAHNKGSARGKNRQAVGSLACQMACGKIFNVGSGLTDELRANPPAVGSIIVYRFQEYDEDAIPRFPVFIGVAVDKSEAKDAVVSKGWKVSKNKVWDARRLPKPNTPWA